MKRQDGDASRRPVAFHLHGSYGSSCRTGLRVVSIVHHTSGGDARNFAGRIPHALLAWLLVDR